MTNTYDKDVGQTKVSKSLMSASAVQPKGLTLYDSTLAALGGIHEKAPTMKNDRISIEGCFQAFNDLAREFPEDFQGLFFVQRSGMPYSRELEDMLFQMGAWRLIEDNNPDYRYFTITSQTKRLIRDELARLYRKQELKRFSHLSKRFKDLIGAYEN
ncbi:MAG: hypothetical protein DDT32_01046 [Syntrophomonadaceae bacterium]|nr:hypothetical protein [Bacillota bacterium]